MPYKSDSQRRWAHTDKGEKALGGPKGVNEWDQASKGKDLPETAPKMAEGGIVEEQLSDKDRYLANVGTGISHGMSDGGITGDITEYLKNLYGMGPLSADKNEARDAEAVEPSSSTVQGFADGTEDVQQPIDTSGIDALRDKQAPQFNPQAGMPPAAPTAMPPVQAPAPIPTQGSAISNYLNQQKQQMGHYGPEQQMAVSQALLGQQNGIGGRLANAGAGLGDAVMSAFGKQSPGFQANLQNRQNAQGQMQMEALKGARAANTENVQENMKLTAQDPTSALSKAAQQSYGPTLISMGATPEQVKQMPASVIADVSSKAITLKEALARIAETGLYHQLMGGQQKAALAEKEKEYETSNPIKTFIAKHFGGGDNTPATPASPEITDQASYDALPKGAPYTHQGVPHVKK